jgi:hypothetical protein
MLRRFGLVLSVVLGLSGAAVAAPAGDKKPADKPAAPARAEAAPAKGAAKADPTGNWTWSNTMPNGQTFEAKLALKLEGDKLTGTSTGRGGDTPIMDGKFGKDGSIAFKVERQRNDQKVVTSYSGKLEGDSIKGEITMNRGDGERKMPWDAKRAK